MPAQRARAAFEPIGPDFDLKDLVENTENFQYADRISYEVIEQHGMEKFEKLVLLHVVLGGKPLVVDGFDERLEPWMFTPKWLRDNHGDKIENARNLTAKNNIPLTIGHYLNNMGVLADQFFEKPENYLDKNRQRIYLKDIDCPAAWQDKLKDILPPNLFYWNESTGEIGGPGALTESLPNASGRRKGKGIAPAGDLMSSLPHEMRAENLMCYIGHEGTYTPAHREMCASLGHNIMVHTSGNVDESGMPEHPGSSIWFMTESKDRQLVSEYWLSVLGHDIEVEDHFAQLVAWQKAPFTTYVVEQKVGDFVLVPPLAPHQVWNRGTRTMKVAWNRTTLETLELALHEALPNSRIVCRDEQYKNKAIIYYTLMKYSGLLKQAQIISSRSPNEAAAITSSKRIRQLRKDFKRLFELFKEIILSEMFAPDTREYCEYIAFDSNVTCSYCRGNIFNRFLSCKSCPDVFKTGTEEPYDVCMDCFVMGRSCACRSKFKWVDQFKWKDLLGRYEDWRRQIIDMDGGMTGKTPLILSEERKMYPQRTTAQICQQQLRLRPWVDINNPDAPDPDEEDEEEIRLNEDGTVKKIVKKKSKAFLENNKSCHVCLKRHPKWQMAMCTMCERYWCFGSLFRAHDLMPQDILRDPNWECPHCRRVCSAGACRSDSRQTPYEPKGTLLGHDTKKVADVRSIECLVDFSLSNLYWMADDANAGHESSRLQRKRVEAAIAKSQQPTFDLDGDLDGPQVTYSPVETIDPALGGGDEPSSSRTPYSYNPAQAEATNGNHGELESPTLHRNDNSMYPELDEPHDGFVAPSAVLYHPPDDLEEHAPKSSFTSINGGLKKKRARPSDGEQIRLVAPKRRKTTGVDEDRPLSKNKASKQYQQEQDKKLLDQARKDGRYLYVWGKIHNKKQVVVLNVPSEKLAVLKEKERDACHRPNPAAMEVNVILRSDIMPPPQLSDPTADSERTKAKSYLVPLEDDADFGASWRERAKKQQRKPRFEEIVVDSDEEDDDFESPRGTKGAGNQRKRASSSWLARKRQDEDEDLPDELPANWKDKGRNRNPRPRHTPAQRMAQKAPRIRPVGRPAKKPPASVRADSDSEGAGAGAIDSSSPNAQLEIEASMARQEKEQKVVELARAAANAALMEEENRRAKLEAAGLLESDSAPPSPPPRKALPSVNGVSEKSGKPKPPGSSVPGQSLGSRLGKKIKIVSAKSSASGKAVARSGPPSSRRPPGSRSLPSM